MISPTYMYYRGIIFGQDFMRFSHQTEPSLYTLESPKFEVLATRDFISKHKKFECCFFPIKHNVLCA